MQQHGLRMGRIRREQCRVLLLLKAAWRELSHRVRMHLVLWGVGPLLECAVWMHGRWTENHAATAALAINVAHTRRQHGHGRRVGRVAGQRRQQHRMIVRRSGSGESIGSSHAVGASQLQLRALRPHRVLIVLLLLLLLHDLLLLVECVMCVVSHEEMLLRVCHGQLLLIGHLLLHLQRAHMTVMSVVKMNQIGITREHMGSRRGMLRMKSV